ncbi:PKD domain-containing protein [Massilia sp. TS11]|uniref:PKD domain-containing protein n=1 Tax=Massilia sp. TS11 TaxID=2908003 RepID=UPI001EDB57AC|nr:PKD domain-containing protein [Massilia sp. TS11]MCG2586154.1 PKD domain-containing protein [Massilia sp. TS11]
MKKSTSGFCLVLVSLLLAACGGGMARKNNPPVASAGSDQTVLAGAVVTMDGSASSDPDGDALTFSWVLASKPDLSAAVLSDVTSKQTSFKADIAGTYAVSLSVRDGSATSPSVSRTVTAKIPVDDFVKKFTQASCQYQIQAYSIDQHLVYVRVLSTSLCSDGLIDYLFESTPDRMVCGASTIKLPNYCTLESYNTTFNAILAHKGEPDLGLGASRQVTRIY